jgi:hypothetical protein
MADVARFVTAAEEGLGWAEGTFLRVYEDYRRTARINALEASNVGTAILDLMRKTPYWEGTASHLLNELDNHLPRAINRKNFPNSPRGMSSQLRRLQPNLREAGLRVTLPEGARRSTDGKRARIITISNAQFAESDYDSLPF